MQTKLQITFRGIDSSEALESYVRERAAKLEHFSDRITGCHVVLEIPHRHQHHGNEHHVRIDLVVPGAEIVAEHKQNDLYASIDAAFDQAKRSLEAHIERHRERPPRDV